VIILIWLSLAISLFLLILFPLIFSEQIIVGRTKLHLEPTIAVAAVAAIFLGGTYRPPLLAVWGKNDPLFIPAGAEAFRRDIPDAEICFFGTGHFALETHAGEICQSN